jgi:hypothetical protein
LLAAAVVVAHYLSQVRALAAVLVATMPGLKHYQ